MVRVGEKQRLIYEKILEKELEGKTLVEVAEVLDYNSKNLDACRIQLYKMKKARKIDFRIISGTYVDFRVTNQTYLKEEAFKEHHGKLSRIFIKLYAKDVINMSEIADKTTTKTNDRIKATNEKKDALKILRQMDEKFVLEVFEYYGLSDEL